MSDDNDHDVIAEMKRYHPEGADNVTLDAMTERFATLDDAQRSELLRRMDYALGQPASARKTSQLVELRQKLNSVHHGLRLVRR